MPAVIDQILTHLRTRAAAEARPGARSPPSTGASVARGARRRPTASTAPHHAPRRPTTPPERPPERADVQAGPFVVRGGAESGLRQEGSDPRRGGPDAPRAMQTGEYFARTTRGGVARRAAPRNTSTSPIEIPIPHVTPRRCAR